MIVDYHVHLREAGHEISHRIETVERWVGEAGRRGIDEIGFTEHVYYFRELRALLSIPYQVERSTIPIDPYVEAVVEAKSRGLPVRLGVEVDYYPGREEELRDILAPYPWDFVLGSIHYLDGLGIDVEPTLVDALGPEEAYRRYFDVLAQAAETGIFDSLAHPDLIKFFAGVIDWDPEHFLGRLDGVCLEVSSAGLRKPHGRLYPEPELLAAARVAGVGITLASDAHEPADLGRDLDSAAQHARDAGYDSITVFEGRVGRQVPLG
jgi:histidinol-phosphatase (PHP family)